MDLESGEPESAGWYSEGSVQRILYDLYDDNNEQGDNTSLGFKPIYDVLVGAEKITPAFTSIFSFIDALKRENSQYIDGIDMTLESENINSIIDPYGTNRLNMGNIPLYKDIAVGDTIDICTRDEFGSIISLGIEYM